MNTYRIDETGSVYLYEEIENAYFFIGKLNGHTEKEFIREYEEQEAKEVYL